jgi:hypothetical protein
MPFSSLFATTDTGPDQVPPLLEDVITVPLAVSVKVGEDPLSPQPVRDRIKAVTINIRFIPILLKFHLQGGPRFNGLFLMCIDIVLTAGWFSGEP